MYVCGVAVKEGEREKLVQEMEGLEKERTKLEADASSLTDTIIVSRSHRRYSLSTVLWGGGGGGGEGGRG